MKFRVGQVSCVGEPGIVRFRSVEPARRRWGWGHSSESRHPLPGWLTSWKTCRTVGSGQRSGRGDEKAFFSLSLGTNARLQPETTGTQDNGDPGKRDAGDRDVTVPCVAWLSDGVFPRGVCPG
jgi:hypothetical protein